MSTRALRPSPGPYHCLGFQEQPSEFQFLEAAFSKSWHIQVVHIQLRTPGPVERVASCLEPSTVELTLPLNATECPKLPFAPVAGNQVVLQDGVQLPCSPLHVPLWRYLQLLPIILTNPCSKFCRQPADNRMGFAKRILKLPLPRQLAIICTNDIWLLWKDIQTGLRRCTSKHSLPE